MNYELNQGVPAKPSGFPLYLCSLNFHLAQKNLSPNPNPISRPQISSPKSLAKDAASIPNALAIGNESRAMNKVAESVEVMMINFAFLCAFARNGLLAMNKVAEPEL